MNFNFDRALNALMSIAITLALCFQSGQSHAKLSVPFGPNGEPPDSETEAAVDNYNNLLNGPAEGQSMQSWEQELQAAHDQIFSSSSVEPSASETSTTDLCKSPLNLWIGSDSTELVADAISDPAVRDELVADLQQYLDGMLTDNLWSSGIKIGSTKITSLACVPPPPLTYLECLGQGLGVTWCKKHYLTQQPPGTSATGHSALSIRLPVNAPLTGVITFEASASYRDIDDPSDAWPYEWCLNVLAYDTSVFGIADGFIRNKVGTFLSSGAFCGHAWNWDY